MKLWGLGVLLCLSPLTAWANDFTNFSVNQQELSKLYPSESKKIKAGLPKGVVLQQAFQVPPQVQQNFEFEKSPLYRQVMDYMEKYHQAIGQKLSGNVLARSRDFNLGVKNMSGFTWQKPIGVVSVIADRQVVPSLFENKWEVQDQLVLSVNAETFIKSLADQGAVSISQAQLRAFAGLSFNRRYFYSHFVDRYEQGVGADYSKLFLAPALFHGVLYQALSPGESLVKQDYFSFHMGGAVKVPLQYGLELSAAVLGGVESISLVKLEIDKYSIRDQYDYGLNIHFNKQKKTFVGAQLSLSLDFLQLLKLSLLKFEYQYEKSKSNTRVYRIPIVHLLQFDLGGPHHRAMLKAVNLNEDDEYLMAHYLHHLEEGQLSSHNLDFAFLFWGSKSSSFEEEYYLKSSQQQKLYLTSSEKKSSHTKSFSGAITGTLSLSLLGFDAFRSYTQSSEQEYNFTYDSDNPEFEQQSSIKQEYYIKKTKGWFGKRRLKKFVSKLNNSGFRSPEVLQALKDQKLVAPMQMNIEYHLGKPAMAHFSRLDFSRHQPVVEELCEDENDSYEEEYDYFFQPSCEEEYRDFHNDMQKGSGKAVRAFNALLKKLYKKGVDIYILKELFGAENIAAQLKVKAQTYDGQPFTYFEGEGVLSDPLSFQIE